MTQNTTDGIVSISNARLLPTIGMMYPYNSEPKIPGDGKAVEKNNFKIVWLLAVDSEPHIPPTQLIEPIHDNSSIVNGPVTRGDFSEDSTGKAGDGQPLVFP